MFSSSNTTMNLNLSTAMVLRPHDVSLTKINSFKGLHADYVFTGKLRKAIDSSTYISIIFPLYYPAELGQNIKCEINFLSQACLVTDDHHLLMMGFSILISPGEQFRLVVRGVMQPEIPPTATENIHFLYHTTQNFRTIEYYAFLPDWQTAVAP